MVIFTVTNLSDSGLGSLRQAIQDSNLTPGTDTINFNFANSLSDNIINLSTGELTITDSLIMNGLGAELLKVDAGNQGFRVFNIDGGTARGIDVSIDGLTITGGNPSSDGGGIYSTFANLTVSNSIISGNTVNGNTTDDFDGGGIYSKSGSLKVINSTISGNTTKGNTPDGGGIYSIDEDLTLINSTISGNIVNGLRLDSGGGIYSARGNVTVIDSTISNNSASTKASTDPSYNSADGGGIFSRDGNLTVTNSTISGNSASGLKTDGGGLYSKDGNLTVTNSTISGNSTTIRGGGIFSIRGKLTVDNSTISGNSATTGGGIFNSATFNVTNTIIANSIKGGDCSNSGSVATNSNNLIEDGSCNPALRGDPNLGPLQNNGGPTLTHALLPGSIAINTGSDTYAAGLLYDQRGSGFGRIVGGRVDIGSYEVQPPPHQNQPPTLAINAGITLDEQGTATLSNTKLQVTDTDNTFEQITYTLTDLPNNGSLLLNGTALAVNGTFTQADIDSNQLTYTHNGSETTSDSFSFTVTDGAGGTISATTFNITVNPVNDNPPVLDAIANVNLPENAVVNTLIATASAMDGDGTLNPLTYSLLTPPVDGSNQPLFTINSSTGAITLTAAGAAKIDYESAIKSYGLQVQVSDGTFTSSTESFTVNLTNVNEAPVITSRKTARFVENGTGTAYTVTATDPEGTTLIYSLSGTDAARFKINNRTGVVTFKTAPNFELPSDSNANNVYNIIVNASDGSLITHKAVAITVTDLNELNGSNSHDPLTGTSGSDYLLGGVGAKTVTGGAGNDYFVFNSLAEVGQRIADFHSVNKGYTEQDKIILTQLLKSIGYHGSNPITDNYVKLRASGSNTILQIDRDGSTGSAIFRNFLQIDNITPTQLNHANNFVF